MKCADYLKIVYHNYSFNYISDTGMTGSVILISIYKENNTRRVIRCQFSLGYEYFFKATIIQLHS